jgi:hypothetical protein
MEIFILRYSHKHGHDIVPCTTLDLAEKAAVKYVRDNRKSFGVASAMSDEEAFTNWYELRCQTKKLSPTGTN